MPIHPPPNLLFGSGLLGRIVKKHIEQLKRDGWGNKRIINHFAKFGIAVDIPEKKSEEKKLPDGQKTLEDN